MKLKGLYYSSPAWFQNLMLTAYGVHLDQERYGRAFREARALALRLEDADPDDIARFQDIRLQELISHAYETVPYYKRLFDSNRIAPEKIRTTADLERIPLLTKDTVRKNAQELVSRDKKIGRLWEGHTSGTTGSPLALYYDRPMMGMTYAALDRQFRWGGLNFGRSGDRLATLRGNIVAPLKQSKPPYWRYDRVHSHMYLSNFHLSNDTAPAYIAALNRFGPKALDGYPSSLHVLARMFLERGIQLPLTAVFTSSETLYDFQREAIQEAFCCDVFDYYGAAERVVFAAECAAHAGRHLFPEYGISEVTDAEGCRVSDGEEGLLVGTSLQNFGMPLIRYVTDDRTAIKEGSCSCGRPQSLMREVTTKAEDMIRLRDGRLLSPSLLTHPFKPLHTIEASQVIQQSTDRMLIKVVPGEGFSEEDERRLREGLRERLGSDMQIEIKQVVEIGRERSGKFKWVVNEIK